MSRQGVVVSIRADDKEYTKAQKHLAKYIGNGSQFHKMASTLPERALFSTLEAARTYAKRYLRAQIKHVKKSKSIRSGMVEGLGGAIKTRISNKEIKASGDIYIDPQLAPYGAFVEYGHYVQNKFTTSKDGKHKTEGVGQRRRLKGYFFVELGVRKAIDNNKIKMRKLITDGLRDVFAGKVGGRGFTQQQSGKSLYRYTYDNNLGTAYSAAYNQKITEIYEPPKSTKFRFDEP